MRYITWRLIWDDDNYGYGPESTAIDNGAVLVASSWVYPSIKEGKILGYLYGDLDISILNKWEAEEISSEQALDFAKIIDSGAYLNEDGAVSSSRLDDAV